MIAKLARTQNNEVQNKDLIQNPNKQWKQQQTMNKQQKNHRLRMDHSRSHWGREALINVFVQTFALESVVVKTYTDKRSNT